MTAVLSGPILKSVADIAKALGLEDFQLHISGSEATLKAMDPGKVMLIEAVMPLPRPAEEAVLWRHRTKAFTNLAKPLFSAAIVEAETNGNTCTLKVGRKKTTLMMLDPRNDDGKEIKIPKHLPWSATFQMPHAVLKQMLSESDSIETFSDVGIVSVELKNGELLLAKGVEGRDRYQDAPLSGIAGADCKANFTDGFLAAVIKPCTSDTMTVRLGTDLPIAFEYGIAGGKAFALCAPWMGVDE